MPALDVRLWDMAQEAYACADEPSRWTSFLDRLRDLTGSVAAGLFTQDVERRSGALLHQVGGDPSYVRQYHEHYARINPWFRGEGPRISPGSITQGLSPDPFFGTEYHEDFWRPQGLGSTLSAYLSREQGRIEGLILVREAGAPEFGMAEHETLVSLVPWLQQAARLRRKLAAAAHANRVLAQALDRVAHGLVILGADGKILEMNAAARAIVDRRDGLAVVRNELLATRPCRGHSLGTLIGDALRGRSGSGLSPGAATRIEREHDDWPISVLVCALPSTAGAGTEAAVLVVISDDAARVRLDRGLLQELYSLTPAEARVAAGIAEGRTLDEVAGQAGTAKETARKQLRAVFEKTGARQQSDLASLILSGVAASPTRRR